MNEKVFTFTNLRYGVFILIFLLLCFGGYCIYNNGTTENDVVKHIDGSREHLVTATESIGRTGRRLDDIEGAVNRIEDRVIDCKDTVERCQKRNDYCKELTISCQSRIGICKEFLSQTGKEE